MSFRYIRPLYFVEEISVVLSSLSASQLLQQVSVSCGIVRMGTVIKGAGSLFDSQVL